MLNERDPRFSLFCATSLVAGLNGINLDLLSFLEMCRTDIAERQMTSVWGVETFDVSTTDRSSDTS